MQNKFPLHKECEKIVKSDLTYFFTASLPKAL